MAKTAVFVAGSPSANSRSSSVLDAFGAALTARGWSAERYSIDSFEPEALLRGKIEAESIQRFRTSIEQASGVIFSTPVYKATYAGSLKVIIDLIDPAALQGKALLGIATARLEAHLAAVDESFLRVFEFFRGSVPLKSLTLLDAQLGDAGRLQLDPAAQYDFDRALAQFEEVLK